MSTIMLLFLMAEFSFSIDHTKVDTADQLYSIPVGRSITPDYPSFKKGITGNYGDYRKSNVPGHSHAGIDIKGNFSEPVYSIGNGTVTHIFRSFPHKTVYIMHNDSRGMPFYSAYVHVEGIKVRVGDEVNRDRIIARIFNEDELEKSNFGTSPHLHFEIRHNIDDNGEASFKSMSVTELDKYCMDPLLFFKRALRF